MGSVGCFLELNFCPDLLLRDWPKITKRPLYSHKWLHQVRWKVTFFTLSSECLFTDTQICQQNPEWDVCFPAGKPPTASVIEVSPVPVTPKELEKGELTLKMKQEYFTALKLEGMLLFGYLYWGMIFIVNFGSVRVKICRELSRQVEVLFWTWGFSFYS